MSPYWYVDANSLCSQCASRPPPTYLACVYSFFFFFKRYIWKCVLCKVLTTLTKFEYSRVSFKCVVDGGGGCVCCSLDWHQQGTCTHVNVLVVPAILIVNIIYFYLQQYDQKNIRRRVYDALNVLMAMNIISKEKKEIRWLGLPTNSLQECLNLEKDKQRRIERIKLKTQQLHDLILQVSYIFYDVLWKSEA